MIVCFAGFKHSGKSEATRLAHGFTEVKMADPLKAMLRTLYRYSDYSVDEIEQRLEGSLKEVHDSFLGCSPRLAMKTLGTEWRDAINNTTLWSDIWYRRVREIHGRFNTNVVCSDVRFVHEIDRVHELGGKVYWINRPGTGGDTHSSETDISTLCDGIIDNSSSLEEFKVLIAKKLG